MCSGRQAAVGGDVWVWKESADATVHGPKWGLGLLKLAAILPRVGERNL